MTAPDELDRQALRMVHQELTARIAGAGWGCGGELPPRMTIVVPEPVPVLADPGMRSLLQDLVQLGRAENIIVELGGQS